MRRVLVWARPRSTVLPAEEMTVVEVPDDALEEDCMPALRGAALELAERFLESGAVILERGDVLVREGGGPRVQCVIRDGCVLEVGHAS